MKALALFFLFLYFFIPNLVAQDDDFFPPEEEEIRSDQEGYFEDEEDEDDFFPPEEEEVREKQESTDEDDFFPPEEEEEAGSQNSDFLPSEESENAAPDTQPEENYETSQESYQEEYGEEEYGEEEYGGGVLINEDRSVQSIMISGTLGFSYIFREDLFADAVLGGNTTNLDGDFFDPRLTLRFDIFFNNNVNAVIELHNENRVNSIIRTDNTNANLGNLFITNRQEDNAFVFEIERAYINITDFLFKNTELQIGIIPKRYALRANGDAFFLDLGESESPFNDAEDINARGLAYRWQPIKALQLDVEAFYFNTQETGFVRQDQSIAGINIDLDLSRNHINEDESETLLVRFFNVMVSAIHGDNNQPIWTLGFGFDYYISSQPDVYILELYGETLFQTGVLDRKNLAPAFSVKNQAHLAFGGYLGARYTYEKSDWKPFVDVSAWYLSGDDDDPNRDKNNDLVTYEDIDSTLIVEENDYGLDVDSNYWAVKFQSGVSLKPLTSKEMRLEILYAHFEAIDTSGGSRHIGEEVDVRLVWEYTSDLTFVLAAGLLFNSSFFKDVFDEIGADGEQNVFMLRFETLLRF